MKTQKTSQNVVLKYGNVVPGDQVNYGAKKCMTEQQRKKQIYWTTSKLKTLCIKGYYQDGESDNLQNVRYICKSCI